MNCKVRERNERSDKTKGFIDRSPGKYGDGELKTDDKGCG